MAGFETPVKSPELAAKDDGLHPDALELAFDLSKAAKILTFVQEYVRPETLDIKNFGSYGRPVISALGDSGSLVHIRAHPNIHLTDDWMSYLSVISHVNDLGRARFDTAQDIGSEYASDSHRYVIGGVKSTPHEVGKKLSVDEERASNLELVRAIRARPEIRSKDGVRLYRRADGLWEYLGANLERLAEDIEEATRRGIGDAVLASIVREADSNNGQYDKNMLGLQYATK